VFKLDNVFYPDDVAPDKDAKCDNGVLEDIWIGDWNDLRELTSITFALDTLITSYGEHWDLTVFLAHPNKKEKPWSTRQYDPLLSLVVESHLHPEEAGINPTEDRKPTPEDSPDSGPIDHKPIEKVVPTSSLSWAVDEFGCWKELLNQWKTKADNFYQREHSHDQGIVFKRDYWEALRAKAELDLQKRRGEIWSTFTSKTREQKDELRIRRAVPLAVLISLHNRMDSHRTKYKRRYHLLRELFERVEKNVNEFSAFG